MYNPNGNLAPIGQNHLTEKTNAAAVPPKEKPAYVPPKDTKPLVQFKERPKPATKVNFAPKIIPTVIITEEALKKMQLYVAEMSVEVGWLGTVEHDPENNVIAITDCFLFNQEVHATTTEITPEGLASFAEELLAQPDGVEIWNKMKMWGHSHVNMGITPSSQDNQQMDEFSQVGHDFFVRLIANKKGELGVDVFYYEKGLEFINVPWFQEASEEAHVIDDQIIDAESRLAKAEAEFKAAKAAVEEEIKKLKGESAAAKIIDAEDLRGSVKDEISQKVKLLSSGAAPGYGYGYGYGYGAGWQKSSEWDSEILKETVEETLKSLDETFYTVQDLVDLFGRERSGALIKASSTSKEAFYKMFNSEEMKKLDRYIQDIYISCRVIARKQNLI